MKYRTLYLLLIVGFCLNAQQPLNLSFETPAVESFVRPWGWEPVKWNDVSIARDSSVSVAGKFSLKIQSKNGAKNDQAVRYNLEAYELRGKTITFAGKTKRHSEKDSTSFAIGYSLLKEDGSYEEFSKGCVISESMDWGERSVELTIPRDAQGVFLQLNYSGTDATWFDDFQLMIGRNEVILLQAAEPFSRKELKWQELHAVEFYLSDHTVSGRQNEENKSLLRREVGESSIVGLGEATHGTAEFFFLKKQLVQNLVSTLGYRVFALEDNQLAVEEINNFVLTGNGGAVKSMAGLFDVWYRTEMLDLVNWVRSYNQQHPADPVYFVGFDMQEVNRPVDKLSTYLQNTDSLLYASYADQLAGIKRYGAETYSATDSVKLFWFNVSKQIVSELAERESVWLSKATTGEDSMNVRWGTQYAQLIQQFCENSYKGYWAIYRDEAMAANISWLKEVRFPGKKIVVWAHDVHVSRGDHPNPIYNLNVSLSMGSFLSRKYGSDYKSYSLSTCQGSYSALKSYTDFEKMDCPLFPGVDRSLDLSLHKVAQKKKCAALFLPLPRNQEWLALPQPKRFANHVSIDYGYWERVSMPYQFDGVFFIDITHPSTPL
ncbi:MAG: erythromycin esterase family protein [Fluviicola sp.]|nr:erythromycin esterase family protein [Fluviicola sp.]